VSEAFDDQLSRVRLMAKGDPTWDLSPNDCKALTAVLAKLAASEASRERLAEQVRYWAYCTDVGMRETCPEKVDELCKFFLSLGIAPYSMRSRS